VRRIRGWEIGVGRWQASPDGGPRGRESTHTAGDRLLRIPRARIVTLVDECTRDRYKRKPLWVHMNRGRCQRGRRSLSTSYTGAPMRIACFPSGIEAHVRHGIS